MDQKEKYEDYENLMEIVHDTKFATATKDEYYEGEKYKIMEVDEKPYISWSDVSVERCHRRSADCYPLPSVYPRSMQKGLQNLLDIPLADRQSVTEAKVNLQRVPTPYTYGLKYHTLLWLEELEAVSKLKEYSMDNVQIKAFENGDLTLNLPSLAGKTPYLTPLHRILIRQHNTRTAYEGIVKDICGTQVIIKDVPFELLMWINMANETKFDVMFMLSRVPLERMHEGIDWVVDSLWERDLFPSSKTQDQAPKIEFPLPASEIINENISHNKEQVCAVKNIINCCSQNAPYVIFGPPGTGKTETIVEAILQIMMKTDKTILVCAQSNATCDMITRKLMVDCTPEELVRFYARNLPYDKPEDLEPYSDDSFNDSCRIVISTLINIGRYNDYDFVPDFIFIDEAGQALEPEIAVALALSPTAQLILAGDPKQLGPICDSELAANSGLKISLLERLMTYDLYRNHNPNYLTMLRKNYRSHPCLVELPNKLFYGNTLEQARIQELYDPISYINIFPLIMVPGTEVTFHGQPNEFCSVITKEQRNKLSPSYFNDSEVNAVMKYVMAILRLDLGNYTVHPSEIGIITPYKKQVLKLQAMLKQMSHQNSEVFDLEEIEVGTVEAFQGREKRVIIISCVRAKTVVDDRCNLGFVKEPKRFNVAITRAKSKLIIIGCPTVLQTDTNWLQFMNICKATDSFYGPLRKIIVREGSIL